MPAGVTFTTLSSQGHHTGALSSDGQVYVWGTAYYPNAPSANYPVPALAPLPAGKTYVAVATGPSHAMALGSNGNAYAWGITMYGKLGNGSTVDTTLPTLVSVPAGVHLTALSAATYHVLALADDGNARGYVKSGALGSSGFTPTVPAKVELPPTVTFTQVSAGDQFSMAVGSDGNAYAWGINNNGQFGNGTYDNAYAPVRAGGTAGVRFRQVSAGLSVALSAP